jgi:hypothetical protein
MDDRKKFIEIFTGLERAYGQTQSRSKNESGKLEAKSWIEKEPLTEQKWIDHLDGKEPSLGIIPIKDDNTCTWGAIDIDTYDGFDHKKLIKTIIEKKLPLVVCKSKSGGAHIFLFVKQSCSAKDMQMKLAEIAAWIGYGESEVFPKQIELNSKGTGNFLNLPYNHPEYPTRYALNDNGDALDTLYSFIEYYETKVVDKITDVVIDKPVTKKSNDDFKNAPPCLVTLASQGFAEGSRNMAMFQLGVYLRQRFPEQLETKLDYYNTKYFSPPLPSREVLTILKQVEDKKYFYRCEDPTFKSVCEKIRCQTMKFGIGNSASNDITSLKKWVSDNPMYEVTHNGKVIILSLDQLANHGEYRKATIAQANESPRPIAPAIWADIVDGLLKNMGEGDYIHLPGEVTAKGQFLDQLKIFLENNGGAKDRQDVLQGMVYEHEKYLFFKPQSFRDFLKMKRFTKMSDSHQYKIFSEFGGNTAKLRVNNKAEHCWKVASTIVDAEYKLKDKDFTEEDPY